MERFIRRENIKHFRDLLRDAKSDSERQRIQILLDAELAKEKQDDLTEPVAEGRRTRKR